MNLIGMEKELGSVNTDDVGEDSGSVITGVEEKPGLVNLADLDKELYRLYDSHRVI